MSYELSGGEKFQPPNNMFGDQNLGFVDQIQRYGDVNNGPYPTKYHVAAAYMFYLNSNHCFIDGNKRTALATAVTFLEWNGIKFAPFDEDAIYDKVKEFVISEKESTELIPEIAEWFESICLD